MKRQQTFAEMWRALSGGQQQAIAEKLARAQGAEKLENVFRAVLKGEVRIRLEDAAKTFVVVPNLSPADLVALAMEKGNLTHLDPDLVAWNYCQYRVEEGRPPRILEVRGKRYEVLTWKPGKGVTSQQVRDHFKDSGADGNTAAFVAWITETKPAGYHASIPSDDALLFRLSDGYLCAPYFDCGDAHRKLNLRDIEGGWRVSCVFVAFREIP